VGCGSGETLLVRGNLVASLNATSRPTDSRVCAPKNSSGRQSIFQQTIDRAAQEKGRISILNIRLLMARWFSQVCSCCGPCCEGRWVRTPEFVGAITDITERKHAEESCGEARLFIRSAKTEPHGSWACVPAIGKHTYWSRKRSVFTVFDPAGGPPRFEEFERRIHPMTGQN